jgi:hypothetical protein
MSEVNEDNLIDCPHCCGEYQIPDCGVPLCEHQAKINELEAELAAYKGFADTYIAKRYANLPQLRADLNALEGDKQ